MKKLILTEEQTKGLESALKNADAIVIKQYPINTDKVLIVKKYLDKGFKRGKSEMIGANGFPEITPIFGMLSSTGEVLQNLEKEKMNDLLIEKFKKMFMDDDERKKFLSKVLDDWYDKKIGIFGTLSVNHV